jgi:hypothetical protein
VKTGHFEEESVEPLGSTSVIWLKEEPNGEPTRNGEGQRIFEVTRTRLRKNAQNEFETQPMFLSD